MKSCPRKGGEKHLLNCIIFTWLQTQKNGVNWRGDSRVLTGFHNIDQLEVAKNSPCKHIICQRPATQRLWVPVTARGAVLPHWTRWKIHMQAGEKRLSTEGTRKAEDSRKRKEEQGLEIASMGNQQHGDLRAEWEELASGNACWDHTWSLAHWPVKGWWCLVFTQLRVPWDSQVGECEEKLRNPWQTPRTQV